MARADGGTRMGARVMRHSRGRSTPKAKPAAEVDFSKREEAREWFRRQPREGSATLAIRSALRILPLIGTALEGQDAEPHIVLSIFRACFVAWVIAEYSSQHSHLRRAAAAAAAATPAA